jgi:heavy metal translocating P-type ATPase
MTQLSIEPDAGVWARLWARRHTVVAGMTVVGLIAWALTRVIGAGSAAGNPASGEIWLWLILVLGGIPLVWELVAGMFHGQFGADLLAGVSIVTAVLLGEELAGALVVLMLSGGAALESFAVRRASSVLDALARRMPAVAHRVQDGQLVELPIAEIQVGDVLRVLPHEICPIDGVVVEGHGAMDEAYLTGEPYQVSKSVGSDVLSGAINGEAVLGIRATRLPVDSRYARIMAVMEQSQQQRPEMRRLGDQLGALYTPLAIVLAVVAWVLSGEAVRFLAVLVIATPCPLLIAIPVAIIGTISLAARRGIIIRDPAVLERIGSCRTMILDKTGTLTRGEPVLVEQLPRPGHEMGETLRLAASLEQYSKHPLAAPILSAARQAGLKLASADAASELPGEGLVGRVDGRKIRVTSRKQLALEQPEVAASLPPGTGGLECLVLIEGELAASLRFRDEPRAEGRPFIGHLAPVHGFERVMIVSGDRLSEVEYLAKRVGITEIYAEKSPEEKVAIVRAETALAPTLYVGDGVNDAPALLAATVGLAMGQRSEVTTEAAGAVILDNMLGRVDELMHIGSRMRAIALQSAVGGMALSVGGMCLAAAGWLPPVQGAIAQEVIDVLAVLNALRAAWPPRQLTDFADRGAA